MCCRMWKFQNAVVEKPTVRTTKALASEDRILVPTQGATGPVTQRPCLFHHHLNAAGLRKGENDGLYALIQCIQPPTSRLMPTYTIF